MFGEEAGWVDVGRAPAALSAFKRSLRGAQRLAGRAVPRDVDGPKGVSLQKTPAQANVPMAHNLGPTSPANTKTWSARIRALHPSPHCGDMNDAEAVRYCALQGDADPADAAEAVRMAAAQGNADPAEALARIERESNDAAAAAEETDTDAKRRCADEHYGRVAKRVRGGAAAVDGPDTAAAEPADSDGVAADDEADAAVAKAKELAAAADSEVEDAGEPVASVVDDTEDAADAVGAGSAERAARNATLYNSNSEAMVMTVPKACYTVVVKSRERPHEFNKMIKRIGDVIEVSIRVPLPLFELVHTSTVRDAKNMMIAEEVHKDVLEAVRMHLCYHLDDIFGVSIITFIEAFEVELQTATAYDCMMILACQQSSKLVVRLLRIVSPYLKEHVATREKRTSVERVPNPVALPPLPEPADFSGYPSDDTDDDEAREKADALGNFIFDDEPSKAEAVDTIAGCKRAVRAVLNDPSNRDLPTLARKVNAVTAEAECAVPPEVRELWRSGDEAKLKQRAGCRWLPTVIDVAKLKAVCKALGLDDPWDTRRVAFGDELAGRLARVLRLQKAPLRPTSACKILNEVFQGYGGTFQRDTFPRPGAEGGASRRGNRYYIQLSRAG